MKKSRIAWWLVGVLVVAALVYLVASKQAPKVSNTNTVVIPAPSPSLAGEIAVGALLPLNGGPSDQSTAVQKALQMATEEINAGTGVDGKKLVILFEDNACDQIKAEEAAKRSVATGTIALLITDLCADVTPGLVASANERHTLVISPSQTSADTQKPGDDYFFSLALSPNDGRASTTSTTTYPRLAEFSSKYAKRYGQAPEFLTVQASAYSSVYLVRDLIEKDGEDTVKMQKTLSTLAGWAGGALADVALDENGDLIPR